MPSDFVFEPRSPRYGPFLVLGLFDTNSAHLGHYLAIFGPFPGHIVELQGKKGLMVTGQLRCTCGAGTVCPSFGHFHWVSRPFFGPKRLLWGTKGVVLGGQPPIGANHMHAKAQHYTLPPFLFFAQIRPTRCLDPRTGGHLVQLEGS